MPSTTPYADDLTAALRERGLRVTTQRVVLFESLVGLGHHATAEEVARAAAARLPGLALPTVYAALDLFEDLGLVRRIPAGGAVLFDPVTDGHAHLACRACGAVADVPATVDTRAASRAAARTGARVDAAEVVLRGLCASCAASAR
jgi:Fur family transcriptional regulator, stress-responsive regulator